MTRIQLVLGLLFVVTMTFSMPSIFADTTGNQPPTVADSTHPSISEFINENNAFTSDNNRAIGFINFDQAYGAFGFDISIPVGSTINGITVNLEGRSSPLCGAIVGSPTFSVRLSNPSLVGSPTGLSSFTGNTYTTTNFGTSDTTKILGSPINTWGNSYQNLDNFWILVTAKCGLLISSMQLDQVTVDVDYTAPVKTSHKCSNCQQPSIGITSDGRRVVDGGITVNGKTTDANFYHTSFPLIQADIGQEVTMKFVIWDDVSNNIAHVEVGLGKGKIGESFGKLEESMIWSRHVMTKEQTITFDESSFRDVQMYMEGKAPCTSESTDQKCDYFTVKFTPIKAIVGDVVFGISIWDDNHNAMTTFFNHGLQIGTESDVTHQAEFVPLEGNGNKPLDLTDDRSCKTSSKGFDRNCPEYQMMKLGQELIAKQLAEQLGY